MVLPFCGEPLPADPAVQGPLRDGVAAHSTAEPRPRPASSGSGQGWETCDRTQRVVEFETHDGVTLRADYIPGRARHGGAVILFHECPPFWDRTAYPQRVLDAFAEKGLAVLNVDRRGSGESEGVPRDAHVGAGARYDMQAAVSFLLDPERECQVNPFRLMLVGASNGTTATMDYTVGRARGYPPPAAVAWLSPGVYTENQNSLMANRAMLAGLPMVWVHPHYEPYATWHEPAPNWRVVRLIGGEHGTGNFDGGAFEAAQLGALLELADRTVVDHRPPTRRPANRRPRRL